MGVAPRTASILKFSDPKGTASFDPSASLCNGLAEPGRSMQNRLLVADALCLKLMATPKAAGHGPRYDRCIAAQV